jgi:UDP-glucose 4-epimerase
MDYQNVLITGGAGFVGISLVNELTLHWPGARITVLDNLFSAQVPSALDYLATKRVRVVRGNTWDIDNIFADPEDAFDLVFHFGEYSRIATSFDDVSTVMKSNLYGTTKVLEAARKWGARVVYSASSSKFGNSGRDEHLSPYAWSKAKMVELLKNYRDWYGLDYEICYFFNVYGPYQIMAGDYATVVGIFERQWRNAELLSVVSPGTQTRDFTHVADVVRGVRLAAEKGLNGEWHFRSGKDYSVIELAELFVGPAGWHLVPEGRGERFCSEPVGSRTGELLGWEPTQSLKDWVNLVKAT